MEVGAGREEVGVGRVECMCEVVVGRVECHCGSRAVRVGRVDGGRVALWRYRGVCGCGGRGGARGWR